MNISATSGDDSGILELIEDATQTFMDYVSRNVSEEALEVIKSFAKKEES